jgi:hypothetical protein
MPFAGLFEMPSAAYPILVWLKQFFGDAYVHLAAELADERDMASSPTLVTFMPDRFNRLRRAPPSAGALSTVRR